MKPTASRFISVLSFFFDPELRAWQGRLPLPIVFWAHGVTLSLGIAALHVLALNHGILELEQVLIVLSAAYTVWLLVSIWRSAANAVPYWASLARWLTIAWALNIAFVLFFLEIELVLRYARG